MEPDYQQEKDNEYSLDKLQKTALSLMMVLAVITFIGANLQAVLWQSSDWLVSMVLPATVVDLTNNERAELKETPLRRNPTLDAAAKLKAQDMAKNEYFAHYSPTGVSPWHWFNEAGYVYAHAGENLAIHFTDSAQVVEAWMNSPTHRENIVNEKYTEIGVGTAKGTYQGYDTVFVVQLFGSPGVQPVASSQPPSTNPPSVVALTSKPTAPQVAAAETKPAPAPATKVVKSQTKPEAEPTTTTQHKSVEKSDPTKTYVAAQNTKRAQKQLSPETATGTLVAPASTRGSAAGAAMPTNQEVVVIESPIIATSSGLAVANITTENPTHAGATSAAALATKPNVLLRYTYLTLGFIVFFLLSASLVLEVRKLRVLQVGYSLLLLFGMTGLWFLNAFLTSGAVIT